MEKLEKKVGVYDTIFKEAVFDDIKTGTHTINIVFLASLLNPDEQPKLDSQSKDYKLINEIEREFHHYIKEALLDSKVFA